MVISARLLRKQPSLGGSVLAKCGGTIPRWTCSVDWPKAQRDRGIKMPRERDKTDAPKRMPSKLRLQREHRLVLESSHRIAADIVSRVEETEIKNRGVAADGAK